MNTRSHYLEPHPHQGLSGRLCCEAQFAYSLQQVYMILTTAILVGVGSLLDIGDGCGKIHDAIAVDSLQFVFSKHLLWAGIEDMKSSEVMLDVSRSGHDVPVSPCFLRGPKPLPVRQDQVAMSTST